MLKSTGTGGSDSLCSTPDFLLKSSASSYILFLFYIICKHFYKLFANIDLFNPPNTPMREKLSKTLFYRWGNGSPKRLSKLPKATHLENGRFRLWAQVARIQCLLLTTTTKCLSLKLMEITFNCLANNKYSINSGVCVFACVCSGW